MKKKTLTVPQLMFVIGTRAALAAGVALLVSGRLKDNARRTAGIALATVGGLTTLPAARLVFHRKTLLERLGLVA